MLMPGSRKKNMRIKLIGINKATYKLADGSKHTRYYAWRGGPPLVGEPGTPEFIASYNAAVATKVVAPEGRLQRLINDYQRSQAFLKLRERTRSDYIDYIAKIEARFGDMPLKATERKETRGIFLDWRDELALKSPRQADYVWTVLARILSWGKDRGRITVNPCERGGRVYDGTRVDHVWSEEDEAAFLKYAPAQLHLPLILALWTGQRQGDLLRLPWSAYNGTDIRLRQSKTGARVVIPVGGPLKAMLDAMPRRSPIILPLRAVPGRGIFERSGGRPAKRPGLKTSHFTICAGLRLRDSPWLVVAKRRLPPSPAIPFPMSARSSKCTTCTAIRRWRATRSANWKCTTRRKQEHRSQSESQSVPASRTWKWRKSPTNQIVGEPTLRRDTPDSMSGLPPTTTEWRIFENGRNVPRAVMPLRPVARLM
jgi:integrase